MGLEWTADWTAEVKARMHTSRITSRRLAEECGYSEGYLSMVLSGKKESKCSKAIIFSALDRLEKAAYAS
jgi:DNA transposition AAA+ family ATPase